MNISGFRIYVCFGQPRLVRYMGRETGFRCCA